MQYAVTTMLLQAISKISLGETGNTTEDRGGACSICQQVSAQHKECEDR